MICTSNPRPGSQAGHHCACSLRSTCPFLLFFLIFLFKFIYLERRERERERERAGERQRERERERIPGLHPRTMRSRPEPEPRVRRSTDRATRRPICPFVLIPGVLKQCHRLGGCVASEAQQKAPRLTAPPPPPPAKAKGGLSLAWLLPHVYLDCCCTHSKNKRPLCQNKEKKGGGTPIKNLIFLRCRSSQTGGSYC